MNQKIIQKEREKKTTAMKKWKGINSSQMDIESYRRHFIQMLLRCILWVIQILMFKSSFFIRYWKLTICKNLIFFKPFSISIKDDSILYTNCDLDILSLRFVFYTMKRARETYNNGYEVGWLVSFLEVSSTRQSHIYICRYACKRRHRIIKQIIIAIIRPPNAIKE